MEEAKEAESHRMQGGNARQFIVQCPGEGRGVVTLRNLFSGMQLVLFELKSYHYVDIADMPLEQGTFRISHCLKGSVECRSEKGKRYQIVEGDIVITRAPAAGERDQLPQGVYHGIELIVDENLVDASTRALFKNGFGLDIDTFMEDTAGTRNAFIIHSIPDVAHIFAELYSTFSDYDRGYLRLKVIELMMLLRGEMRDARAPKAAQPRIQGNKKMMLAYRAQEMMMHDLSHPLTIDALAKACNASPTYLKESFKETFDLPIYTWYRNYRIKQAQVILRSDPDLSIANVALEVGYSNASKFTQAFKACVGMTPLEWRKSR